MANYCANSIVFYGEDKDVLKDLWEKINYCMDTRQCSVKSLLKSCGYTEDEAAERADGRDYFTYLDDAVTTDYERYYFKADTDSAWNPNIDSFKILLQEKYNGKIKLMYQSEEAGCGIFITNDINGIFFSERYRLDFDMGKDWITEYFTGYEDLVNFIADEFPKAGVKLSDDTKAIEYKVKKAYKFKEAFGQHFWIDTFSYDIEEEGGLVA